MGIRSGAASPRMPPICTLRMHYPMARVSSKPLSPTRLSKTVPRQKVVASILSLSPFLLLLLSLFLCGPNSAHPLPPTENFVQRVKGKRSTEGAEKCIRYLHRIYQENLPSTTDFFVETRWFASQQMFRRPSYPLVILINLQQ